MNIETKRSVVITDSCRPQFPNALEVQGKMTWIGFKSWKFLSASERMSSGRAWYAVQNRDDAKWFTEVGLCPV